jgi:hypothetical protein
MNDLKHLHLTITRRSHGVAAVAVAPSQLRPVRTTSKLPAQGLQLPGTPAVLDLSGESGRLAYG